MLPEHRPLRHHHPGGVTGLALDALALDSAIDREQAGLDGAAVEALLGRQAWEWTGGAGADDIRPLTSAAGVAIALTGRATLLGMAGNDLLEGGSAGDLIDGSAGVDTLWGGGGAHVLHGGGLGDPALEGYADLVYGGAGNDRIDGTALQAYGGDGDDRPDGGAGRDSLAGGSGADVFAFAALADTGSGSARDVVTGFASVSGDVIDLRGLGLTFIGSAAFSGAGQVRFNRGSSALLIDADGDGLAEAQAELTGVTAALAADDVLT